MTGQPHNGRAQLLMWAVAAALAGAGAILLLAPTPFGAPPAPLDLVERTSASTEETATPAAVPGPSVTPTQPAPPPPAPTDEPAAEGSDPPGAAQDQAWRAVVDGFAVDFTRRGDGHTDWLTRVQQWTTADLAEQLAGTDPARIPSGELGRWEPLAVGPYAVDWTATYDTGLVLYGRVEVGPLGWQVTAVTPAPMGGD